MSSNDDLLNVKVSVLRIRDAQGNLISEQSLSNQNIGDVLEKSYNESFSAIGERREVAVAFAQDAEGNVQASIRFGEWGKREVKIGQNVLDLKNEAGGKNNISMLAESHTHPFEGNVQIASGKGLNSAAGINEYFGYNPRHFIVANDEILEYQGR